MKLSAILEAYQYFSKQASSNARKLSFAAIGMIWVLRPGQQAALTVLPRALLWAGASAIAALSSDFLQYTYATLAWGVLHRKRELSQEKESPAPRQINWPTNALFALKLAFVGVCYAILLAYVASLLSPS